MISALNAVGKGVEIKKSSLGALKKASIKKKIKNWVRFLIESLIPV